MKQKLKFEDWCCLEATQHENEISCLEKKT